MIQLNLTYLLIEVAGELKASAVRAIIDAIKPNLRKNINSPY